MRQFNLIGQLISKNEFSIEIKVDDIFFEIFMEDKLLNTIPPIPNMTIAVKGSIEFDKDYYFFADDVIMPKREGR